MVVDDDFIPIVQRDRSLEPVSIGYEANLDEATRSGEDFEFTRSFVFIANAGKELTILQAVPFPYF